MSKEMLKRLLSEPTFDKYLSTRNEYMYPYWSDLGIEAKIEVVAETLDALLFVLKQESERA